VDWSLVLVRVDSLSFVSGKCDFVLDQPQCMGSPAMNDGEERQKQVHCTWICGQVGPVKLMVTVGTFVWEGGVIQAFLDKSVLLLYIVALHLS
jgi:hypothetical protein